MTEMCCGHWHVPVRLSATRRYEWEEIRALCRRRLPPYSLRVEGALIPITNEAQLQLACRASSAYHDWLAYNVPEDDGFSADMREREQRILAEMQDDGDGDD
jgi:hypothetical protein